MPPHVAANALSWHCDVLLQPPHWPLTQRSGAQSLFCVHARPHVPETAPVHVCEPPQFSLETQPHVPPLQIAAPAVGVLRARGARHVPPQRLPAPQSALEAQAFALHIVLVHLRRRRPAVGVDGARRGRGARGARARRRAVRVDVAFRRAALGVVAVRTHGAGGVARAARVLHLAPVHRPLDGHAASPAQVAGVLHLALLQVWLEGHAASPAQVAGVLHLALLQSPPPRRRRRRAGGCCTWRRCT